MFALDFKLRRYNVVPLDAGALAAYARVMGVQLGSGAAEAGVGAEAEEEVAGG
jgi:hypothetical protein